jgi:23S rRNA pseudouridine2605 synthase
MARERLHKILAAAGIASRRRAEELIAEGHVTVDGQKVTSMGVLVDPETQDVRYDGQRIHVERPAYYALNKPKGYLCTSRDDFGRKTVLALVDDRETRRIYPVGRLEEEAEGLLLLTNDGEFANHVTHARYGVDRTYEVRVRGYITSEEIQEARDGVWLSTGKTPPIQVYLIRRSKQFSLVKVVARGGGDRDLRRVFAKLGHNVDRLVRTKIGTLTISGLRTGESRRLAVREVRELMEIVPEPAPRRSSRPAGRRQEGPAIPRGRAGLGGGARRDGGRDERSAGGRGDRAAGAGRTAGRSERPAAAKRRAPAAERGGAARRGGSTRRGDR